MKTARKKISEINPAAYNPRVELKPGDNEYEALKNSLERFGQAVPLVVNETTGNLISGHQRLNVLKAQGETEAEVVLVELNEEQEKLLNIALNKIEGDWDYQKLEALFEDIGPEDVEFTGFSREELDSLFDVGTPEFNDEEEGKGIGSHEPEEGRSTGDAPFSLFLSFASRESAERWLESKGIESRYEGINRTITIRMEGLDYGR